MKKQIIITIILLIATAVITVFYFGNLNPPGTRISRVMRAIPDNASLIFEFNNDKSFYDIFTNNKLFTAVIGRHGIDELSALQKELLQNSLLEQYFTGQNIFISIHPSKTNNIGLLVTIPAVNGFDISVIDQLSKQRSSGLLVTPLRTAAKQGYTLYLAGLKERFYLINDGGNIFSGSFSKEIVDSAAAYKSRDKQSFVLMSEQESDNSLANLYVNYSELSPLFNQLFKNSNTDIFKRFRLLSGLATLSLNYKTDALMFNGSTTIDRNQPASYLNLFSYQQPVTNHLKDIFPSTTAYSINLAVSNPIKFGVDLSRWYAKSSVNNERDELFKKIKAETGTSLHTGFENLLGNEFAIVTTRYFEKFGIIAVKDGTKLKSLFRNVSKMTTENSGQLNYEKVPFFLLGDAFNIFKRPYFLIVDNYLILANSPTELASYYDTYIKRKFLNKNHQYNQFDNLLSARSNVAFLFDFKNSEPVLKRDMDTTIYNAFENNDPGWKNFYAASWQLTAADKNFYTNFCIRLNTDTAVIKK